MSTIHQLVSRNIKFSKRIRPLVPALKKCPQKRGVVQKIFIQTPKKPNSAKRKVAKVKLSTGRVISCYIPGIGHKLTKHSVVLVRGGRAQDLIGVRYKPIFGKFDFVAPVSRISRLSKFGLSNKQRNSVVEDEMSLRNDDINKKKKRHYNYNHYRSRLPSPFFYPLSMQYNVYKLRSSYKHKYYLYYSNYKKDFRYKLMLKAKQKKKNKLKKKYQNKKKPLLKLKKKLKKKHKKKRKKKLKKKLKKKIKKKLKKKRKTNSKKNSKKKLKKILKKRTFFKYKSNVHFLVWHSYKKFIKNRIHFSYNRRVRKSIYNSSFSKYNSDSRRKYLIRLLLHKFSCRYKAPFLTLYDKCSTRNKVMFLRIFSWIFKRHFYSSNGILTRLYNPYSYSFYNIFGNNIEEHSFLDHFDELISPIMFNQKLIDDSIGYIKVRKGDKYVNIPVDVSIPLHLRRR